MATIERLARAELKGISLYLSDRDVAEEEGLRFADLNENARDLFGSGLNRYPDPQASKLAARLASYCKAGKENVLVFNGSDEAIDLLIRVFCAPGKDSVLVLEPTYSMYGICAEANGVAVESLELGDGFQPDVGAVLRIAERKKPKLIFACSPNNPSGNLMDFARLEAIAKGADAILVVDEAYAEYSGKSFAKAALRLSNAVVLRTFSKAWALAGARVGYCIAPPAIIRLIQKMKLPYSVNSLSQKAALGAFRKLWLVEKCVKETVRERERLSARLKLLGMRTYRSDANFIMFSLPAGIDARLVQRRLAEKSRILVRDRSALVPNSLRVTVCTPKENDEFLRGLLKAAADAIFFDIDGTLVDVSRSYCEAIRKTAEKLSGRSVPPRLVSLVKSQPGMNNDWDAAAEVLRRLGVRAARKQVVPVFQGFYLGKGGRGLIRNEKLMADSRLIRKIKKPIAIVTGRPRKEAEAALAMLGFPRGAPVVAMEDTKMGKPDPAPLLLAKKMLGARLPLYIGDSPDDCEAARRAGCPFVAIGKGKAQPGEFARFEDVNEAIREVLL